MEATFRRMLEMVDHAIAVIGGWFAGGADEVRIFEPATWSPGFWALIGALAALMVLALWRRRAREPMAVRAPEILVTRGELVPDPGSGRRGSAGTLTMTVSNLSRYPVQVLEVAVNTGGERHYGVTEVSALVPAMGEVDVEARLPVSRLDDGVLDVFVYAAATRVKTYRHRAELVWEPWAKRFKVAPLEQRIIPARALPSTRHDAIRLPEDLEPPHGIWASPPAPVAPTRVSPAAPRPTPLRDRLEPADDVPPAPRGEVPGGRAAGTATGSNGPRVESAPLDGLRDLVIDEGITPLPARSAALDRREAAAAGRGRHAAPAVDTRTPAERPAPGPAELFALLSDGGSKAERAAGRSTGDVDRPVAPASASPPTPRPSTTPSLHDLLVTDGEVVPVAGEASPPMTGSAARAGRAGPARGARDPEARASERDTGARNAAVRDSGVRDRRVRDSRARAEQDPERDEREHEPHVRAFDDDRLLPRRKRDATPLEFPDEF